MDIKKKRGEKMRKRYADHGELVVLKTRVTELEKRLSNTPSHTLYGKDGWAPRDKVIQAILDYLKLTFAVEEEIPAKVVVKKIGGK